MPNKECILPNYKHKIRWDIEIQTVNPLQGKIID